MAEINRGRGRGGRGRGRGRIVDPEDEPNQRHRDPKDIEIEEQRQRIKELERRLALAENGDPIEEEESDSVAEEEEGDDNLFWNRGRNQGFRPRGQSTPTFGAMGRRIPEVERLLAKRMGSKRGQKVTEHDVDREARRNQQFRREVIRDSRVLVEEEKESDRNSDSLCVETDGPKSFKVTVSNFSYDVNDLFVSGESSVIWDEELMDRRDEDFDLVEEENYVVWDNEDEGFVEVKDYGVPDTVKSMSWCGENICLGIRREYVILNASNGAVTEESADLESKKMSPDTLMALIKFSQKQRYGIVEKATAEGTEEAVSDVVGNKGRASMPISSVARAMAAILDTALLQALMLTGQPSAALEVLKGLNYCNVKICEEFLLEKNQYLCLLELYKCNGMHRETELIVLSNEDKSQIKNFLKHSTSKGKNETEISAQNELQQKVNDGEIPTQNKVKQEINSSDLPMENKSHLNINASGIPTRHGLHQNKQNHRQNKKRINALQLKEMELEKLISNPCMIDSTVWNPGIEETRIKDFGQKRASAGLIESNLNTIIAFKDIKRLTSQLSSNEEQQTAAEPWTHTSRLLIVDDYSLVEGNGKGMDYCSENNMVLMSTPCVLATRKLAESLTFKKEFLPFDGDFVVEGTRGSYILKIYYSQENTDPSKLDILSALREMKFEKLAIQLLMAMGPEPSSLSERERDNKVASYLDQTLVELSFIIWRNVKFKYGSNRGNGRREVVEWVSSWYSVDPLFIWDKCPDEDKVWKPGIDEDIQDSRTNLFLAGEYDASGIG